jgi:PTS system N-acetylglucosamine-specific IIC component
MFLAPSLYAMHAVLTGAAMVTMDLLQCRLGFGFSAGLFDYVLNFNKATHPLYLVPVGAFYFALYYFVFRYAILRFNLRTPGREADDKVVDAAPQRLEGDTAGAFVLALGGAPNLVDVSACTTRLRLELADRARVDREALKRIGARGTVDVGSNGLQVVVGPMADNIAGDIRIYLDEGRRRGANARPLVAALGGVGNIESMQVVNGRVLFEIRDGRAVDREALRAAAPRGVAFPAAERVHVLHPQPDALEASIAALLR